MKAMIEIFENSNWQILQGGMYLANCLMRKFGSVFIAPLENLIVSKFPFLFKRYNFRVKQNEEVQIQLWNILLMFINSENQDKFQTRIKNLRGILWNCLRDQDEISFSSYGIIEILQKLHEKNKNFKFTIELLDSVIKFLLHNLKSVRKMTANLLKELIRESKENEILRLELSQVTLIIQVFFYERDEEIKETLKELLSDLISKFKNHQRITDAIEKIIEFSLFCELEGMVEKFSKSNFENENYEISNPYLAIYPIPESSSEQLKICEVNFGYSVLLLSDLLMINLEFDLILKKAIMIYENSDSNFTNLKLFKLNIQNQNRSIQFFNDNEVIEFLKLENHQIIKLDLLSLMELCQNIITKFKEFIMNNSNIKWNSKNSILKFCSISDFTEKMKLFPDLYSQISADFLIVESKFNEMVYLKTSLSDLITKIEIIAERATYFILQIKVVSASIVINGCVEKEKKPQNLNLLIKPLISAMNIKFSNFYSKIVASSFKNVILLNDNINLTIKVVKNMLTYDSKYRDELETFKYFFDFSDIDTLTIIRDLNEKNFILELAKENNIESYKGLTKIIRVLVQNSKYINDFTEFPEKLIINFQSSFDKEPLIAEISHLMKVYLIVSLEEKKFELFLSIWKIIQVSFRNQEHFFLSILSDILVENLSVLVESASLLINPILKLITSLNFKTRKLAVEIFPTILSLLFLCDNIPSWLQKSPIQEEYEMGIEFFKTFKDPKNYKFQLKYPLNITYRKYQEEGIKWLSFLTDNSLPGCLCDEMGLGKTIQILTIIQERLIGTKEKCLIVCPSTVVYHWLSEISKFTNSNEIKATQISNGNCDFYNFNIFVTSYNNLPKCIKNIENHDFLISVLDEGHFIKNPKTKIAKTVKEIRSKHRFVLTGTPIQNSVAELWGIFDFLFPGYLGDEEIFKKKYTKHLTKSIVKFNDNSLIFSSDQETNEFTESENINEDGVNYSKNALKKLMLIQKICNHPKFVYSELSSRKEISTIFKKYPNFESLDYSGKAEALKELLIQAGLDCNSKQTTKKKRNEDNIEIHDDITKKPKILIFSRFRETLSLIALELEENFYSTKYKIMDGSVDPSARYKIVESFNMDPDIQILLLTTKVGGVGLNLNTANHVIMFDHDFNPVNDLQAIDRAHRIGQKNTVFVYRLITKDSLEEKILGFFFYYSEFKNSKRIFQIQLLILKMLQ